MFKKFEKSVSMLIVFLLVVYYITTTDFNQQQISGILSFRVCIFYLFWWLIKLIVKIWILKGAEYIIWPSINFFTYNSWYWKVLISTQVKFPWHKWAISMKLVIDLGTGPGYNLFQLLDIFTEWFCKANHAN